MLTLVFTLSWCPLRVARGIVEGGRGREQKPDWEIRSHCMGMTCPLEQGGVETIGFKRGSSEFEMFEISSVFYLRKSIKILFL